MRIDTFITTLSITILLQLSACTSQPTTEGATTATPSAMQSEKKLESERTQQVQLVHEMLGLSTKRYDLVKKARDLPPDQFVAKSDISLSIKAIDLSLKKLEDEFFKQARRQFVSAGKAGNYQPYVDSCIKKIEAIRNERYPEKARGRLYGKAIVTFTVVSSGTLGKIELSKSSGQPLLDEVSLESVRYAAPFSEFPKEMAERVDVLSIAAPFSYTNADEP